MSGQPAASGNAAARVLLVEEARTHDVFEVVEVADGVARVKTAYLFELGEELRLRIEDSGTAYEVSARVVAHAGAGSERITELELGERSAS